MRTLDIARFLDRDGPPPSCSKLFQKLPPRKNDFIGWGNDNSLLPLTTQLYSDIGFKQVNFSLRLFAGYYEKFLSHSVGITQKDDG